MEYKNVYNVDEADVQDVEEYSEPIEEVTATVLDKESGEEIKSSNIDGYGILYSILALALGVISVSSLIWENFSFILCITSACVSGYFSFKYLFNGYHHKVFGKFAIIGFLLSLAGIVFGILKIVLISMTSLGKAFLWALF